MTVAILDASALLALLKGEAGADRVADVIGNSLIGAFNLAEVISYFVRLGAPITDIRAMLDTLPLQVSPADEALAWEAGALRDATAQAGLSLGDRFCLALARREGVPAYTADRVWNDVADTTGIAIVMIR